MENLGWDRLRLSIPCAMKAKAPFSPLTKRLRWPSSSSSQTLAFFPCFFEKSRLGNTLGKKLVYLMNFYCRSYSIYFRVVLFIDDPISAIENIIELESETALRLFLLYNVQAGAASSTGLVFGPPVHYPFSIPKVFGALLLQRIVDRTTPTKTVKLCTLK